MNVSAVATTVVVKPPEVPVFKAPDNTPDVQNGAAADGTRTARPTRAGRPAARTGNADRPAGVTARRLALRQPNAASSPKKRTIMPWVMEPAHDRKAPFAKHHIDRRDRRAAVRCGRLAAMARGMGVPRHRRHPRYSGVMLFFLGVSCCSGRGGGWRSRRSSPSCSPFASASRSALWSKACPIMLTTPHACGIVCCLDSGTTTMAETDAR